MHACCPRPEFPPRPHRALSPVVRIWFMLLFAGLGLGWWGQAQAATPVGGDITVDTTWTKTNSPYEVTDTVFVDPGVTLTIEAGVEMMFNENTSLQVDGSLVAHGNADQRIHFRGKTEQPGFWFGIDVGYTEEQLSSVSLDYVIIEHAGYGGGMQISIANATIRNTIFRNNSHEGLNVDLNGPLVLADSSFIDNGLHGVRFTNGYIENPSDPQLSNLSASGNGKTGEGYNAVVYDAVHWENGDHTLEAMGLPYALINGFFVEAGGNLIIAPGIEAQVENGFYVRGALNATGTADKPILITGIVKQPGGWGGMSVSSALDTSVTALLDHVIIEYGGVTNWEDSSNLSISGANVTVRNSLIRHGGGHGIYNSGGAPDEVYAVKIENTKFENNARAALVCDDESCKQTVSNLTATGNGINAIVQRRGLWGTVTWANAGLPYLVEGFSGIDQEGTLTIEPGVEIRMAEGAWFGVSGTLKAIGTADQPIRFTGVKQEPGAWHNIRIDGSAELRYCDIGYGGETTPNPRGMVEITTNTALINNCTLHHSADAAIRVFTNATPLISFNSIENNAKGLVNDNGGGNPLTVDARNNWWGSPTGPTHASNPGGQGQSVSDRVDFVPWLTSPGDTGGGSALLVQVGGVGRYSPGDTIQYAIAYANPTKETVQDAVLRLALPANSSYVDSTGSAVYWPERRQLFWKLGALAPGAGGLLAVRVTYDWGLPDGLKTAIVAQLGGKGVDEAKFDVAEYLAYQPRFETGVTPLSVDQVQALRAADPKLQAIYSQAEAAGYQFGDATERTYNTTEKLTQVILMRVVNGDVQAYIIWRTPSGTVGVALDGSSLNVFKPGQEPARYDLATKSWQRVVDGQVSAAADAIGWDDCMMNCIEDKLPGEVAEQLIKAYSVGKKAVGCVKAAGGDKDGMLECSKVLDKAIPVYGIGVELVTCNNDCDECVANGQGCDDDKCHCCTEDKYRCDSNDWLWGWMGKDAIKKRECGPNGIYLAEVVVETCALCDKCVMGSAKPICVPKNQLATQLGLAELTWVDASIEPARADLVLVSGASDSECEECLRAKDPNAIHGPAGDLLPGQWVTYTIEYENVGGGEAHEVFIVNPLSEHFDLATLVVQGAETDYDLSVGTRTLYFTIGTLAPKGQDKSKGQVTYRIKLKEGLVSGTVIANQAVVHFPSVPEETPTNTAVNVIQPIAVPDQHVQVTAGQPVAITLAGTDASHAPLSFAVVDAPVYGTLAGGVPALTYTPQPTFAGIDRLVFTASNGTTTSRQAEVVIEVLPAGNDSTKPTVKWTSPAHGAVVASSQKLALIEGGAVYAPVIQIQFSEPMDAASIGVATVEVKNASGQAVPILVQYDPLLDQAVAMLMQPGVPGATYTVTVKQGVTDLAKNGLAADHTWSFQFGSFAVDSPDVFLPLIQQ